MWRLVGFLIGPTSSLRSLSLVLIFSICPTIALFIAERAVLCKHSRPFWKMWATAVWSLAFLNGSFAEDGLLLPVALFCAAMCGVCLSLFIPA